MVVRRLDGYALVAQWIEHRFPKPGVAGPIPAEGTTCVVLGVMLDVPASHEASGPNMLKGLDEPIDINIIVVRVDGDPESPRSTTADDLMLGG